MPSADFGACMIMLSKAHTHTAEEMGDNITERRFCLGYNEATKNKSGRYPYELRRIDPEQKVRP
jgi:hypothetical protein